MKFVDRLKQSFSGTNTAVITLGGAVSGFRTVQQAIADSDLAIGEEIPMGVREGATWELSLFKVDSPTQLSRLRVLASWNGGTFATFPAGSHEIACADSAEYLNGQDVASVAALTSVADAVRILGIDTSGSLRTVTASVLKAYTGGTAAPADTLVPSAPTNLSSNSVTQTSFNVTFTPGTDNIGVARSEWSLNGTSWTSIGSGSSFSVTGRTAGTLYSVQVRTVDTSGNVSSVATLNVTTAQATSTPDSEAPTWIAGSLSATDVTSSGYTMVFATASDNVGVDHLESSIDGGTTWATHPDGTTSRVVTGRTAGSTDQLRLRALDAAGNISNVLTATVTLSAAPATPALTAYGASKNLATTTTAAANVTANKAGTLHRLVSTAASVTDPAIVKAAAQSQAVSAAGAQRVNMSGVPTSGTNYLHLVLTDADGVDSAVVSMPIYVVRPYNSNAAKATVAPSAGTLDGAYRYYNNTDCFANLYWYVEPASGAGVVYGGWGDSDTVEPDILATGENTTASKKNGLVLLTAGGQNTIWQVGSPNLWALDGEQSVPKHFWLKPGKDAPGYCLNPGAAGTVILASG